MLLQPEADPNVHRGELVDKVFEHERKRNGLHAATLRSQPSKPTSWTVQARLRNAYRLGDAVWILAAVLDSSPKSLLRLSLCFPALLVGSLRLVCHHLGDCGLR